MLLWQHNQERMVSVPEQSASPLILEKTKSPHIYSYESPMLGFAHILFMSE
jgi:hypothetical protein